MYGLQNFIKKNMYEKVHSILVTLYRAIVLEKYCTMFLKYHTVTLKSTAA